MKQNAKHLEARKKRARAIIAKLKQLFPRAQMVLNYGNNWELLVAVELSAQCTDKKVNEVTQKLFKKYRIAGAPAGSPFAAGAAGYFSYDLKLVLL